MPGTYEPIATSSPTSGNSVTFNSISSSYTDLIIVSSIRTDKTSASSDTYALRFNGDTGSNYSAVIMRGSGSSATSFKSSGTTMFCGEVADNNNTSGIFSPNIVSITNYSNSTTYKTAIIQNGGNNYLERCAGLWRSTSAINSITLMMNNSASSFVSGTTITIYGIKAA